MTGAAHGEVQVENDRMRVTRWTIEPGGAIPMHRHHYDYAVIPLVTGTMFAVGPDGDEIVVELEQGSSYAREAGAEHRMEHRGDGEPIVFVEVERLD